MGRAITGISATQPKSGMCKVSAKDNIGRNTNGENRALLSNFEKMQGRKPKTGFLNESEIWKTGDVEQNSEERQARIAKVEGLVYRGIPNKGGRGESEK